MTYSLMIVEDEEILREGLLTSIPWSELGYRVVASVSSGEEALELYGEYRPDSVLTDIKMYGVSGLDLLKEVKSKSSDCEVVLLSGYEDFGYAKQGMEYGAFAYVLKLNLFEELPDVFRKLQAQLAKKHETLQLVQSASWNAASAQTLASARGEADAQPLPSAFCSVVLVWSASELRAEQFLPFVGQSARISFISSAPHTHMLLLQTDESAPTLELETQKIGYRLQQLLNETSDSRMFAGMGDVVRSDSVEKSYRQANKMLDIARLKGIREPLKYGRHEFLLDRSETDFSLARLERMADFGLIDQLQEEMWRVLTTCVTNQKEDGKLVQKWCTDVLVLLFRRLESSPFRAAARMTLGDCLQKLSRLDSIVDTREWLKETIGSLAIDRDGKADGTERIQLALAYIDQHYDRDLNMNEVARLSFMSASYFSIKFKTFTGYTFTDYLIHKRLTKAMDLLAHTKYKISDISKTVGYEDEKYFARIFKKKNGVSPYQYREGR